MTIPFVSALCPHYRRPDCLRNTLWLWNNQTYPAHRRRLIIMDDGGTWPYQEGSNWSLYTSATRYQHFPQKYQALADRAPPETEFFLIWEDDDVYLPHYVEYHAQVLQNNDVSKSKHVMSNYPGHLVVEESGGRFFSSLAFRKATLQKIGGFGESLRADYDQQFMARLADFTDAWGNPWGDDRNEIQFVYGWHTGHHHAQSYMKGGADESYYWEGDKFFPPVKADQLEPVPMSWVLEVFKELGYAT